MNKQPKPSRTVKRLHRASGTTLSLKAWAREHDRGVSATDRVEHACSIWLSNKGIS